MTQKNEASFPLGIALLFGVVIALGLGGVILQILNPEEALLPSPTSMKGQQELTQQTVPMDVTLPLVYRPSEASSRELKLHGRFTLKQLLGDHPSVLLNLWATWCPPCIEELPVLEKLNRKLQELPQSKRPLILTISVDDSTAPVQEFLKTLPFALSFPIFLDRNATFAAQLGTKKYPETYFFGRNGRVLKLWIGPQDWLSQYIFDKITQY